MIRTVIRAVNNMTSGATTGAPPRLGKSAASRTLLLCAALGGSLFGSGASAAALLIRHAQIHTLDSAGTLDDADLLIRDGRIAALGKDLAAPDDAQVLDARGQVLTPGLFGAYSHLGLVEIDGVEETVDTASNRPRYSAALDVSDALNPRSSLIPIERVEGITHAMAAPDVSEGGSLIAGQGAVIALRGEDDDVLLPRAAMFAQLGEDGAALSGGSRAAAWAALREAFDEARRAGKGGTVTSLQHESQLGPLDVEALQPVLRGEVPLVLGVDRAADILAALRFAEAQHVQLVIRGGAEAHLVASQLAAQHVPVILDPTLDLPASFERLHARADAAAILYKAGVVIAFLDQTGASGTHNLRNLRQLAGNAVANGLDAEAALAAITLNPAKIYGLETQLGSLAVGKLADCVLWSGDPLEVTTAATAVWISGQAIPLQSRQTLLRDRYLQKFGLLKKAAP